MKNFNQRWLGVPSSLLAATTLLSSAAAVELPPDDASIAGSLGAWFKDPANNFDTETGIWADSSGNDRHAVPVGEVNVNGPITYLAPTLATITGSGLSAEDLSALHFAGDAEDLLACLDINGGTNLTELTIFVVYNVDPLGTNTSLARPVGIGSVAANQFNPGDHFNLGSDPSIRKDNGNVGANQYSQAFQFQTTFIRSARMSPAAISEWFNYDGTPQLALNLTGFSYTTSNDDFYLGDLRAGVAPIPGVNGSGTSQADFDIAQTIVYTSALTDQQIADINEWLTANPGGSGGGSANNELAFTKITVAEGNASVSLTWRSKPNRQYAVDLSYDLQQDRWQELNDEIDSGGAETSTSAPTFSGVDQPDPLPDRVYYRVREVAAQ